MADKGWIKQLGVTPGRLSIVVLLAIALVAVLLFQIGGPSAPASMSQCSGEPHGKPRLPETRPSSVAGVQTIRPCPETMLTPKIALEDVIRHDPFALSGKLAQLASTSTSESKSTKDLHGQPEDRKQRVNQAMSTLRNKGVRMVFLGESEQLAIVGDRPVRVGDVLEGLQVISITSRGIMLSERDDKRP